MALCFTYFCLWIILGSSVHHVESIGVKINKIADRTLPAVKKVTKPIGLDPLSVPTVTDDLSLATINLTEGVLLGASKFKRNKNIILSLVPSIFPTVRINASLYIPAIRAKFNYSLSAFVYTDSGMLDALIDNVTAHITLDYRILALKLSNPTFKIDSFGDVAVNMTSDSYINWLQNIIADNAIPFYKEHIAAISEDTFKLLSQKIVDTFNENRWYFTVHTVLDVVERTLGLKK